MRAFMQNMGADVWEITMNQLYDLLAVRTTPLQVTQHEANAKAVNALFASVSRAEMKSRPVLLGACKLCPTLRLELKEKNALIKSFGKTKIVESSPPINCSVCPGLISDLDSLAVEKANLENENTYLRAILSWVSSSEP